MILSSIAGVVKAWVVGLISCPDSYDPSLINIYVGVPRLRHQSGLREHSIARSCLRRVTLYWRRSGVVGADLEQLERTGGAELKECCLKQFRSEILSTGADFRADFRADFGGV